MFSSTSEMLALKILKLESYFTVLSRKKSEFEKEIGFFFCFNWHLE